MKLISNGKIPNTAKFVTDTGHNFSPQSYLEAAYDMFELLKADSQFFTYQGNFSDKITSLIISLIEESFIDRNDVGRIRNKVSFLMVESFQNIIRHSTKDSNGRFDHTESFQVRNIGNDFYIMSTNLIPNSKVDDLKQKLDKLNTLDKNELKRLYMESLNHNDLSEKGGAGLGLIEMARKSGNKLKYAFVKADDENSYFYLQTRISNSSEPEPKEFPITDFIKLHQDLQHKGVFVLNKGVFSHEAIMPMLNMVENNLVWQHTILSEQKLLFHLLVELLQNISNHAFGIDGQNEGIFFMGHKAERYFITAGNYIANGDIEDLRRNIDLVNSKTPEELRILYLQKLREGKHDKNKGAGIGLIDLARFSKSRLDYKLFSYDDEKSFFTITVTE